jgi:hypothetical protein
MISSGSYGIRAERAGGRAHSLWRALQLSVVLLLAVAAVALAEPGVLAAKSTWLSYLLLVGVIGCVGWLGWRLLADSDDAIPAWLHPPVLMTGYVVFLVGLPGLFIYIYPHFFVKGLLDLGYFAWGMALVLVGMMSLWVGYALGWNLIGPLDTLVRLQRNPVSVGAVLSLYVLTIFARLVRIAVQGVAYAAHVAGTTVGGSFDQWLSYLEGTRYLVLAIVAVRVFQNRWPRGLLIAVLGVEGVYAFTSGFTKPLFWIALITLFSAGYAGIRLRQYTRYLVLLGLAGVLVVPISEGLRKGIQAGIIDVSSAGTALASTRNVFEMTWGQGFGVGWELFVQKVPGRFASVSYSPGLAMSRTPSYIPHLGYDEFLQIPLHVVPRVLWPEKPSLSRGQWFSANYLDMPASVKSSTAVTLFGESYLFAGWPTAILGLALLGLVLAVYFKNTAAIGLVPLYISTIPGIIDVETELSARLVSLFQGTLFTFGVYFLLVAFSRFAGHRENAGSELLNVARRSGPTPGRDALGAGGPGTA